MTRQTNEVVLRLDLFYLFCAAVTAVALMGIIGGAATQEELWPVIGIFCGTSSLFLIWSMRLLGLSWLSGPVVYLVYLWVFHFPLMLLLSFDSDLLDYVPAWMQQWVNTNSWYEAGLFSVLCSAAFIVGAVSTLDARAIRERPCSGTVWKDDALRQIGLIETCLGTGMLLFAIFRSGGTVLFAESYGSHFDDVFALGTFTYGIMLATQGIVFAALGVMQRSLKIVLIYMVAFTSVMLLLGARTAGLAPILLFLLAVNKRGVRLPRWVMISGMLAMLWVISFVGAARLNGVLGSGGDVASEATPVKALLELGGSLETVSLSFQWIENGDSLQLGGGYWLPFERAIGLVIPGVRSELKDDSRAMSEVLASRTHGLGGSAVAESYYNFGLFGAFAFFFPLGYLIGRLDCANTPRSAAWFISILYPLMINVRDWFLSVPAMVFVAILPLIVIELYRSEGRQSTAVMLGLPKASLPARSSLKNWNS